MPLQTSREDLNAMLTLTNLRKWVETWPNRLIGKRGNHVSCPISMYLREGQGVLLAETGTGVVAWTNVDLERMESYREDPEPGYSRALRQQTMVLPDRIQSFISMVDHRGGTKAGTKGIMKTTVLKYIDQLQHKYREGPHCECTDKLCLPARRSICQGL